MKNKKKILIIEDNRVLIEALKLEFEEYGFEVKVFMDGQGAYENVVAEKPDLIILDLILPGIHGFEILRLIKNNNATKNIPVVIATNLGEETDREEAMKLGAIDFYVKAKVDLSELSKKIYEIIKS